MLDRVRLSDRVGTSVGVGVRVGVDEGNIHFGMKCRLGTERCRREAEQAPEQDLEAQGA